MTTTARSGAPGATVDAEQNAWQSASPTAGVDFAAPAGTAIDAASTCPAVPVPCAGDGGT